MKLSAVSEYLPGNVVVFRDKDEVCVDVVTCVTLEWDAGRWNVIEILTHLFAELGVGGGLVSAKDVIRILPCADIEIKDIELRHETPVHQIGDVLWFDAGDGPEDGVILRITYDVDDQLQEIRYIVEEGMEGIIEKWILPEPPAADHSQRFQEP